MRRLIHILTMTFLGSALFAAAPPEAPLTLPGPVTVIGVKGDPGPVGPRGPQGEPGPPGRVLTTSVAVMRSGEVDVTAIGLTPSGTNNAALLMADYATRPGPVTYFFPAGSWRIEKTLRLGEDGVSVRGAGRYLTALAGDGGYPVLCLGVKEKTTDGFAIGPDARPDAFGVLDASIAPGAGRAWGFATQGRTSAYLPAHGLSLGTYDPTDGWDYHGGVTALTVRLCVGPPKGGRLPAAGAIVGVGGDREGGTAAPVLTGFWTDAAAGNGTVVVEVRCQGDAPGRNRKGTFEYGDPTQLHRLSWGIDLAAGKSFGMVDGVAKAIAWDPGDDPPAGSTLEKSTADYPWQFGLPSLLSYCGTGAPTPDFVCYGFSQAAAYLPDAPANDRAAYLDPSGPCLGLFQSDFSRTGRGLPMTVGAAAGGVYYGEAVLLDTPTGNNIQGGAYVSDLTIDRGAPGLLAGVGYDLLVERIRCRGGVQGISNIRAVGGSYWTTIRDSEGSGTESGMSLFETMGLVQGCTSRMSGATSFRLSGCAVRMSGVMGQGFGPRPENFIRSYGAPGYGNILTYEDCTADNEGVSPFTRAGLEADQGTTPTRITLRNVAVGSLAPGASLVRLTGYGGAPYFPNPELDAAGLFVEQSAKSVVDVQGPTGIWTGTASTTSSAPPLTGSADGRVTVTKP